MKKNSGVRPWDSACISAGLGIMVCPKCEAEGAEKRCAKCKRARKYRGRIFHDLRRSAARNLIRSGVARNVAMRVTGHLTEAMFNRYNIVDEADLREAMQKVTSYQSEQRKVISIAK